MSPSLVHDDMFTTLSASLPTTSKRRIKQSILLAQKLMEKHREVEATRKQLSECQQQLSDTTIQVCKYQYFSFIS
jgi:hypothetical protein